ncbi:MAG: hypothetical protein HZA67_09845 [Rhodospirillales bacterium]|nr:hypothetical protein [Rhodospirillales bacterium]
MPSDAKKNISFNVRISDGLHSAFRTHVSGRGMDVSSAVRSLMELELERGILGHTEHPSAPIEGVSIPILEFETKDGRRGIRIIPYRASPVLVVIDCSGSEHRPAPAPRGLHPHIDRILDLKVNLDWDSPEYRTVCLSFGLDPDHGRPIFRPEHASLGAHLLTRVNLEISCSDIAEIGRRAFLYDMIDLLRADIQPEITILGRVQRDIVDYEDEPMIADMRGATNDIAEGRSGILTSSEMVATAIRFLPSEEGRGYHGSFYGWYDDCCQDGWSNTNYNDVRGVALYPEHETPWNKTVVKRLREQGVHFLTQREAAEYMQREGARWSWIYGCGVNSHGIKPRSPEWWEKVLWWVEITFRRLSGQSIRAVADMSRSGIRSELQKSIQKTACSPRTGR